MPGKPCVMAWAAADSESALKARYRSDADRGRRPRLHGRWLLRQGQPGDEGAAAVGGQRRTAERWIDWERHEGGIDGLLAHRQGGIGQPSRLTPVPREPVAAAVATGPFRTAAAVGPWIAAPCAVTDRPAALLDLLGRLRCHPTVPRPPHEPADLAAQDVWKQGACTRPCRPRD